MTPRATYRVQFGQDFKFDDAAALAPYLSGLGISHLYASPYLKARPNSTHGYDITDHNALNEELGDNAAFSRMIAAFETNRLKHIVDFVPNHMGVGGSDNPFWLDVLEWGENSVYADWFDVDWESHSEYLKGKLLVPFLGDQYGAELAAGKLCLRFDPDSGEFAIWAYDVHKLPVSPLCYPIILGDQSPELARIAEEFAVLTKPSPHIFRRAADLKKQLAQLVRERADVASSLESSIEHFNGIVNEPATWRPLSDLIRQQHWRPAYFRVAADDINYRRFFNINELAGLRMELPEVFEHTHRFILDLIRKGTVDGVRIDHIDGLFDPKEYLVRLRHSAGAGRYLVVEKILARHERLRQDWPIDGTTGYDFVRQLTELLIDPAAESAFSQIYLSFTAESKRFSDIVYRAKLGIMENEMASELLALATKAARVARQNPASADFTQNLFYRALKEVIACFPVYRTYVSDSETTETDRRYIRWAIAQASKSQSQLDPSVFVFLEGILTCGLVKQAHRGHSRHSVVELAMNVQQYSGPVMAKGLEDTALFRYNRFIALNEVGSSPEQFGSPVQAFHQENIHRSQNWPNSLLATSTHDTKHGEDARARLAALSLVPEEWAGHVKVWSKSVRALRGDLATPAPPSRNDEYLFFQNLIATWPVALTVSTSLEQPALTEYSQRITKAMVKSLRESRVHTNWISPNAEYENAMTDFISHTLHPERSKSFFASFLPFQQRIALMGVQNSLAQTVLKLTSPGVPDFYQGCELWDFSMMDPDNRQPVNYEERRRLLAELKESLRTGERVDSRSMWHNWQDGRIKLFIIYKLLEYRRATAELFEKGIYEPIFAAGDAADHVCAFRRQHGNASFITVVSNNARMNAASFRGTSIPNVENETGFKWRDVFTGRMIPLPENTMPVEEIFAELPVAVLSSRI
jgi:(1->4)-alpha-D-glucan 1-alpha-D-glucosylmutase